MKQSDIALVVTSLGGEFHSRVKRDTDYLVVGGGGSPFWKFGIYGRKADRAMRLQAKGQGVAVIPEKVFWKACASASVADSRRLRG